MNRDEGPVDHRFIDLPPLLQSGRPGRATAVHAGMPAAASRAPAVLLLQQGMCQGARGGETARGRQAAAPISRRAGPPPKNGGRFCTRWM